MNAQINGRHYIAGQWRTPTGPTFTSTSPSKQSETIGVFPLGTKSVADEAVAVARQAFPGWRRTSRILRAELFDKLAQIVKRETDSLALLMARECGKVITECRAEVVEGLHMIQYVFGTGRMPTGEILSSEIAEKDAFMRRKPWGVAAVITPWNFPFAVPLWMLGPSLVEGNTVVFKPSEDTPAVGQRIVELFEEAGFPPGVINLVHGEDEAGEALVKNPGVNCVLFTGSYDVGKRIAEISAGFHDRIVASETGSKSAVIICEDARMDLAVTSGIISAFKTSGQRCVSAGRILVHEKLIDAYAEKLVATAKRLKIGDPLDANNFTGPLINKAAVEKVERYNALAKEEGAEILLQGVRILPSLLGRGAGGEGRTAGSTALTPNPSPGGRGEEEGNFLSPTIYRIKHGPKVRCIREEVFGPHLALIPFKDIEEAARIYNDTEFGLSMAVITENYRTMRYLRDECDYGMGYVNLPCIGAEVHLPFGGVKKSGNGHPSAAGLIEAVTHKTAWTVNHAEEVKMAQGLTTEVK